MSAPDMIADAHHPGRNGVASGPAHVPEPVQPATGDTADGSAPGGPTPDARAKGELSELVRRMLELLGEDPDREGLRGTPERVARSLRILTSGGARTAAEVAGGEVPDAHGPRIALSPITVRDIEFHSLCERSLLPFFGRVHLAYVPGSRAVGSSTLVRLVDSFARRLQMQERLTNEIADAVESHLGAVGVAVSVQARHLRMEMQGVHHRGSETLTTAFRGVHRTRRELRDAFRHDVHSRSGGA